MNTFHLSQFFDGKNSLHNFLQKIILLALTLICLLIIFPYYLWGNFCSSFQCQNMNLNGSKSIGMENKCDIFKGNWIPYGGKPYYTNETCYLNIDQVNCLKFGRRNTEFLKWRWQPNQCELPFFNALQFLNLVKGKSMAFVGDSVGRNQFHSLLCLLSSVVYPEDLTPSTNYRDIKKVFYSDYNFTVVAFWSPFLVENEDVDPTSHSKKYMMNVYLDKVDEKWASEIENYEYVIISSGPWFLESLVYYEDNKKIGCNGCDINNITNMKSYQGYQKAFRTVFKTLLNLKNYKGVTFLRTFSPSHFENGEWNIGGNCPRMTPFKAEEKKLDGVMLDFYVAQLEELMAAKKEAHKKGLRFRVLDITEAMNMRPDGHPNYFGRAGKKNGSLADCVHWCLPGPIDTWNEYLLHMLKMKDNML